MPVSGREPDEPRDEQHRIARSLNLTVAGCPCRRCAHLRDLATISMSRFGFEDDPRWGGGQHVLDAIGRVNAR